MSISEVLKDKKQRSIFWEDEEETVGQLWTVIAEESETAVAIYQTYLVPRCFIWKTVDSCKLC